jgi:hypothetical protein
MKTSKSEARLYLAPILICFLNCIPTASKAQDQCASSLVRNTFNGSYSSVETLAAFRLRYGSSSNTTNTDVGVTVPVEGLPVGFNYGSAASAAANYFDQSEIQWGAQRLESVATQTLSAAAVETYKACRKSLPTTGPRVLVYDATRTGATVSVTWFSGPGAPTKAKGTVELEGGSLNIAFPEIWETGQKITRTIKRGKSQDLRVVVNIGGSSDDEFVSQLPPPIPPQPVGIKIGSCIGRGGVEGVRMWGPSSEYCNGIPGWGAYDAQVRLLTKIGSCVGHEGEEGVRLYGPIGEPCGGKTSWGVYANAVDILSIGFSSCKGHGDILEGHDLWGPTGALCGGMTDPRWGKYQSGTKLK